MCFYSNCIASQSIQIWNSHLVIIGNENILFYYLCILVPLKGWITLGNKNRATAATGMNDKSSRSHSVFTIVLTQTRVDISVVLVSYVRLCNACAMCSVTDACTICISL